MLKRSIEDISFTILTTQRSGSTWLVSLLDRLENIQVCDELFLNRTRTPGKKYWDSDVAYPRFIESRSSGWIFRPFSVFSYLDRLYNRPGAVGFKLMYSHLKAYPEIWAYLACKRVAIVHLTRQNYLDILISSRVKNTMGRAHILPGEPRPETMQIDLEPYTLIPHLKKLQHNQNFTRQLLKQFRLPHIEVVYEDLVRDATQFDRVWEFLAIKAPAAMPAPKLVKIRRGSHADVIRNYKEIKAILMDSAFAHLID